MRSWHPRELHCGVTLWGKGVIELSKKNILLVDRPGEYLNMSSVQPHILVRKVYFLQSLTSFLCSALGLLWQCVDSLRCANPFDIGWIDSCWPDAPCHFVCCHLIGAPQFAFPPLFLPSFTVARFCLTSKARLCVPSKSLKSISAAVQLKRTFYNRTGGGKTNFCHVTILFLKSK